jgi:hypothetical protein
MAAGADRVISFDPPGAIGLVADAPTVLFRFDETDTAVPPKDAAGAVDDLLPFSGGIVPVVADGVCGRARVFDPTLFTGFISTDLAGASSLVTRDCTIQAILRIDAVAQNAYGQPGTVVARGIGGSLAQYCAYALEVTIVNPATFLCSMRWVWHDTAGVQKIQTGAQFTLASPGTKFTMLTATRRWVSPTSVLLRYYIGDVLLGEVSSADGSIGGGTPGKFLVGARPQGAQNNHLAGTVDELMVLDREITHEEIEATWLRITRYQPLGYQLLREMHDPGFPLPTDPGSNVQRDLRLIGNSLGYAAALFEDIRQNILPQHAYGSVLEDWEEVVRSTPAPSQDIDTRRSRVLAHIRQRRGCSIPGLEDSLVGLLGGADVSDLEFIAFDNTVRDSFATLDSLRWDITPSSAVSLVSGAASFQPGAGSFFMDGATWPPTWITMRQTVGGSGKQAHQLSKLVWTTPQANAEAGIYFENAITRDYLLLGLRDVGGSFRIETESFIAGVSQGVVQQAIIGANPAAIWLHLYQTTVDGTWQAAWSTTSATTGFSVSGNITHPTTAHWGGCYLRGISALGSAPRADFDDHVLRSPFGSRPFNAYVLLDRALGFTPDVAGADAVILSIRHAFTHAAFITSRAMLCDDLDSGCGMAPCGGY